MWYMVCEKETGKAISLGTVLPEKLDDHLEAIPLGAERPAIERLDWDAGSKSYKDNLLKDSEPLSNRERAYLLIPELVKELGKDHPLVGKFDLLARGL